jgi:hypothetical protein
MGRTLKARKFMLQMYKEENVVKRINFKSFIMGVVVSLLLGITHPVIAEIAEKQINVGTGVNVYLDDIKLNPKDANGNPVEVFIMEQRIR